MVDNCSSLIGILIEHIQSIELNYNSGTIHFKAIFCLLLNYIYNIILIFQLTLKLPSNKT